MPKAKRYEWIILLLRNKLLIVFEMVLLRYKYKEIVELIINPAIADIEYSFHSKRYTSL